MPDYQKLYLTLFNSLTDAISYLDTGNIRSAKTLLMAAQVQAEEQYMDQEDPPLIVLDPAKHT